MERVYDLFEVRAVSRQSATGAVVSSARRRIMGAISSAAACFAICMPPIMIISGARFSSAADIAAAAISIFIALAAITA
jgi:hypothetical protein